MLDMQILFLSELLGYLCEFREKVRQYCINKFVRTTLLSENIILFENNTYILVKKKGEEPYAKAMIL